MDSEISSSSPQEETEPYPFAISYNVTVAFPERVALCYPEPYGLAVSYAYFDPEPDTQPHFDAFADSS